MSAKDMNSIRILARTSHPAFLYHSLTHIFKNLPVVKALRNASVLLFHLLNRPTNLTIVLLSRLGGNLETSRWIRVGTSPQV